MKIHSRVFSCYVCKDWKSL